MTSENIEIILVPQVSWGQKINNLRKGDFPVAICLFKINNGDTRKTCGIHAFLHETLFFNSASVLLNFFMNWAPDVAWVLLIAHNHHHTVTSYICYIVLMSSPSFIYVVSMWSIFFIFRLVFIMIDQLIPLKQTHLLSAHVPQYFILVLDNINEESE